MFWNLKEQQFMHSTRQRRRRCEYRGEKGNEMLKSCVFLRLKNKKLKKKGTDSEYEWSRQIVRCFLRLRFRNKIAKIIEAAAFFLGSSIVLKIIS